MGPQDYTHRPWILFALMLFMMLAAMDINIISTAVPHIVSDLGDFSLFTWVFSAYLITQTVTIPIYGKLADLFGRKKILIFGAFIFLLASATASFAWDMPSLIASRALQGVGAGGMMATINTLAGDLYTVKERAKIQGFLSSVWAISALAGPLIGGTFADYVSWRWIFFVNIPIGLLAMGVLLYFLKERIEPHKRPIDYWGSLSIMICITSFILALQQGGQSWPWLSVPSLGLFAITFAFALIAYRVMQRTPEPVFPNWLWKNKQLTRANLSILGLGFITMAPVAYLPLFGQAVYGLNAVYAGLVLAVMSLTWPTASALSGQLYLRIGFRYTALLGCSVMGLAIISFVALPFQASLWWVVLSQLVIGAGFGLMSTSTLVGAQSSVDWGQRGVVTGANMFTRYLGQSIGVAVFGAIFNATFQQRMQHEQAGLSMDEAIHQLQHAQISADSKHMIQEAIYQATHHIFIGAFVVFILTLALIIWLKDTSA